MRRTYYRPISEVIKEYLEELKITGKLKEYEALRLWEELLGKTVASRTKELKIKNGILYVKIRSPLVKQELLMIKDSIIKKMNEKLGDEIIKAIVFI